MPEVADHADNGEPVFNVAIEQLEPISDTEETTRTPVALVNQTMASEIWPGQDPLGRRTAYLRS
jgi:hypothetical protein